MLGAEMFRHLPRIGKLVVVTASCITVETDGIGLHRAGRMFGHGSYHRSGVDTARQKCTERHITDHLQLDASVAMQMVSDVPLGAFLSGGVDSSAVVASMAKHATGPVKTYAIGFDGDAASRYYNELPYARQVAEHFGTEHHEILVRPEVAELLPRLLWHLDEPISDSAFLTAYLVSEFARREVTVILSGVGGDELFGGYRRYLGEQYAGRYQRLPGVARSVLRSIANHLPADRHSRWLDVARLAHRFILSAELPFEERYRSYKIGRAH